MYDRQRAMVRIYKMEAGACMDCAMPVNDETIVCFDLDHRDPALKSFTISYEMGNVSDAALHAEMLKCDVVCRNCHALRTYKGQHYMVRRKSTDDRPTLFDVA